MARNSYAKNLIGNWETEQYEPLYDTTLAQYNTNWNKLTNDFNNLKDTLKRNEQMARLEYGNQLNNIQGNAYDRMKYGYQDAASRGLSNSGIVDRMTNQNIEATGEEVDKALSNLLNTSGEVTSDLASGNKQLADSQLELYSGLNSDLAGITDAEAQNTQTYANLVASISQSAADRAYNKAVTELEDEADEIERKTRVADVLRSDKSDIEKIRYLSIYLDVPADQAKKAVSAYNSNMEKDAKLEEAEKYSKKSEKYANIDKGINSVIDFLDKIPMVDPVITGLGKYATKSFLANNPFSDISDTYKGKQYGAEIEYNNLTYQDLYDILYGRK